jgi:hypothetical protein
VSIMAIIKSRISKVADTGLPAAGRVSYLWRSLRSLALLVMISTFAARPTTAASVQEEARNFFEKFVAAQNAHNAEAVQSMLWDSPDFLWISRGNTVRGSKDALETYRRYFGGTWHLKPDMDSFQAAELPGGAVRIIVPVEFLRGGADQPPQRSTFLIAQIIFRDTGIWRISTILPVADTRLK